MKSKLLLGFLFISLVITSNQAKAQENDSAKVNWSEYYPLHVGDFWVYEIVSYKHGISRSISVSRVTKDSIMSDGHKYYLKDGSFERVGDTLGSGIIWRWQKSIDTAIAWPLNYGGVSPINGVLSVNMWGLYEYKYSKGIGEVYYYNSLFSSTSSLTGAYINGVVHGDISSISVEDKDAVKVITDYSLNQNYPNPFNPTTNISFLLPKESFVSLVVYNMLGEKVEILLNEYRGIGKHTVTFDAHNLPSGIYFYTLQTNGLTETKKMLFLK